MKEIVRKLAEVSELKHALVRAANALMNDEVATRERIAKELMPFVDLLTESEAQGIEDFNNGSGSILDVFAITEVKYTIISAAYDLSYDQQVHREKIASELIGLADNLSGEEDVHFKNFREWKVNEHNARKAAIDAREASRNARSS